MKLKTRVCVLGAGAGGTGCVYQLLKRGIPTVVIDRNPDFGGTAVFAGVDGFEPGVSLDGLHRLLVEAMQAMPLGCHVVEDAPNSFLLHPEEGRNWESHSFARYPWGLAVGTDLPYEATLGRKLGNRLQFEPDAMVQVIRQVLAPYQQHLTELFGYRFLGCTTEGDRIIAVTVEKDGSTVEIEADWFVDASGDIVLARAAGCACSFGEEAREVYAEPSAPEVACGKVNAVSYVFRIAPTADRSYTDPEPPEADPQWEADRMRKTVSCFTLYPNGDINVNMLPTMQGQEYFALGDRADELGQRRVRRYWHWLQQEKGMRGYTLARIYQAGIRESWRLQGRHVLTEQDIRKGGAELDSVAAIADHALDIHGKGGMCRELEKPYAIPLECTQAQEYANLMVACRGASFSHIAASSARLTRTMLSLGESVGKHIADQIAM